MTLFSREPAVLWLGLLAPTVQVLAAFVFSGNPTVQGVTNTAAVAVAAALTAWLVHSDHLLPLIVGAIQALIALVVAFGLHAPAETQALVLVPLGVAASVVVRDRVTASVPARLSRPVV